MHFKLPIPTKRHIAEQYAHNVDTGIEEILDLGTLTPQTSIFIELHLRGLEANIGLMKLYCEQPDQLEALGISPVEYQQTYEQGRFISDLASDALRNFTGQKLTP